MHTHTTDETTTATTPTKAWAVDVNDTVTWGPFSHGDAVAFSAAVVRVPGVTDVVVRVALDDDVFAD